MSSVVNLAKFITKFAIRSSGVMAKVSAYGFYDPMSAYVSNQVIKNTMMGVQGFVQSGLLKQMVKHPASVFKAGA